MPIPTISQLREITQKEKLEGRERPWLYKQLTRGPSIYITRALLPLDITPNTISFLMIVFGVVGALFTLSQTPIYIALGLFLLYVNILLDKVDGELARYKKVFSLRGIYLDEINHLIVPGLFLAAITISQIDHTPISETFFIGLGMLAALSMPFIRIGWSIAPQMYAKKFLKRPELFTLPEAGIETKIEEAKKKHSFFRNVLSVIHQFQEFLMILITFGIALALEQYVFFEPVLPWLVIIYGILLPFVFIENTLKGFIQIEQRIANINRRFQIKK